MMEVGEMAAAVDMGGFWLPSGFLDDGQFPGGEDTFGGDRFSPAAGATAKVEDELFFSGEVASRKARPSLGSKSPAAKVSSPRPPPAADAFGLLYAGAGQIAGTRSPSPTSFPRSGYYPSHAQHIQRQREKELIKHQLATAAAWVRRERAIRDAGRAATVVPPPAWIPAKRHQQHNQIGVGSGGTRAFFFSGDGGRNSSAGTGVFLPRGAAAAASEQQRQKSATAITSPAVAQALDLTLAELAVNPRVPGEIHVVPSLSKNLLPISAAHSDLGDDASPAAEICLPPEWIY